jgi:nicotinamide-nucleotide amidase
MKRAVNRLVKLLEKKKLTIAFAESMTCGLAAHQMSTVKGTACVLAGSLVCYREEVKQELLKIPKQLIRKHTAESQPVTDALARNLGKIFHADIYAAVTGLASPGGSETKRKPVGTVFLSFIYKDKLYHERKLFRGTPLQVKRRACREFFRFIADQVEKG